MTRIWEPGTSPVGAVPACWASFSHGPEDVCGSGCADWLFERAKLTPGAHRTCSDRHSHAEHIWTSSEFRRQWLYCAGHAACLPPEPPVTDAVDWSWGVTADGHNPAPQWRHLYGWCFTAWQYQPGRVRPWWLVVLDEEVFGQMPPGTWLLRRPGDVWPFGSMTDDQYRAWQHPREVPT